MLSLLETLIERASQSNFWLVVLNLTLRVSIPFNAPHGFKVTKVGTDGVGVKIPYKRKNFNHIRGIHACAFATASEFASGLALFSHLPASEYRLIMKSLNIEYFYQGKKLSYAECKLDRQYVQDKAIVPLEHGEKCLIEVVANCYDSDGNHLCKAIIEWQLKKWAAVSLK
jgi:acyl-coenzyme A thioesterase PaaI-like protein